MEGGEVGLAVFRQAVDDVRPQVGRRFEKVDDILGLHPVFEGFEFGRPLAQLHIFNCERMLLVHHKNQAGNLARDGAVVLHLGDGNGVTPRHITVTVGKDAGVNIRLVHQLKRFANRLIVAGRQVLHHHREHTHPQTRIHHFLTMVGQIAGRTADHYGLMFGCHGGDLRVGWAG